MIDWAAVAAIATVGTVVIGYMQIRASKGRVSGENSLQKAAPPPVLNYVIKRGSGSYRFPGKWRVNAGDENWTTHSTIEMDLKAFKFAIVSLHNANSHPIERISLDLSVTRMWSASVGSTRILSSKAIVLQGGEDSLRIQIPELPAREIVEIAICGGYISNYLETGNAAVILKRTDE